MTTWHPPANSGRPELRVTARYYRDGAGRVSVDAVEGMGKERVIITGPAASREAYELDAATRIAFKTVRGHVAMLVAGGCGDWYQVPVSKNLAFGKRERRLLEVRMLAEPKLTLC